MALAGLLAACSDKEDAPLVSPDGPEMSLSLSLKGLSTTPAAGAASMPALSVFQFDAAGLYSKSEFDKYDATSIGLIKGSTTALYCVSGIGVATEPKMNEADFLMSTVESAEGDNSAPLFLTGYAPVEESQMRCELTMRRGVARIDLDASDADMEITEITVDDAPAASYVFAGEAGKLVAATTVYKHTFDAAPTGLESGVFMLFESAGEVHVTVHGTANGATVAIPAVIPAVERGKVYTLRVYESNATIRAGFSVADWGEGGTISGQPDMTSGLFIDKANSVFPEGVTVDYQNNIIDVPGTGVKGMKIAFSTELRVDLDTVCYEGKRVVADSVASKYVRIAAQKAYNTPTGVVTAFDVDIDGQLKGRPAYEMKMYVRKTNMGTSYDYVTIRVAQSPFQIETVTIAGLTWMAFNCTTPELDDQIYVEEGLTVEDMYVKDWVKCVGGLFQFGRRYKYIPYQGYNPSNNLGGQTQDIPWVHETHMPCPEGFHVPSLAELRMLFPNETTIPGTYVAGNGETIKVELVRLPGDVVTPTNVNGVCRYLKFISQETGNCLILPLAGYKGDKSTAASSNFGRDGVYWSNENPNCPGGYARAYRFLFNWGDKCNMQEFQFQMEAFAYVRAVKDN